MFSRFFIERPVFAAVVSIIICIAGVVALFAMPVEQYPPITPVQVTVQATYPGADSRTLADSVAAPLEAQINGIDNMLYMSSTSSSSGMLTITVYFGLNTDPDVAQVQVQNRVNLAVPQLPVAVTQQGVSVQKKTSSIMMLICITSRESRYSSEYIANYANVYVLDALKRVPGAGQASIMGVADQAMRIWMDPERMASLGITTSDIQQAVSTQNSQFGAGQIGQQPNAGAVQMTFPVVTQRPFTRAEEYDNIILRASQDGSAIVRLKDVARAEVGLRQYVMDSKLNGRPATLIAIYQQPGANGLKVSREIRNTLEQMKKRFPSGIDYVVSLDTTEFVRLSIKEVQDTLIEAIVLVVLVVFLFLQNFRATIICAIAIFVALIGSFPVMLSLGFSINLLTLFGLVLAIGIVVDDAIVVVENVERNMSQCHLSPREATIKAMGEVTSPVIATVLVMGAVFVSAAFLPGTTGQLYKQFAITIAISVAISGFVALTLTPALSSLLLRHSPPPARGPFAWFNRQFDRFTRAFGRGVVMVIRRMAVALLLLVVLVYGIVHLFRAIPTSFVPNEDQGYVMSAIFLPDAASLERTMEVADRVDRIFAGTPGVENRTQISGYSLLDGSYSTNNGTFFVTLKPFEERYQSVKKALAENARAVLVNVYKEAKKITTATVYPVAPPAVPGIGVSGGFEFWIQDKESREPAQLEQVTRTFLEKARQRKELSGLNTTFKATAQQLRVEVDRDKANLLGVPVQDVYNAIQAQFGSLTASQFNEFSRVWWVILQSSPEFRQNPGDIARLYTRSRNGEMVPLSAVITTSWVTGPNILPHFNGFPAAKVNGNAAEGFSSGQALQAMEEVAGEVLPAGYSFAWSGLAYEEKSAGGTSGLAFAFGLVFVFLILAAQYESWTLPGSIMTAVPFGVLGALLFNWMRGLQNDVYFQIGLLVLVGLGAKNALLRVTFAVELRKQGRSLLDATIEAGELRLRPIVMTSLAFICGVFPLAVAMGAGANARHSIGTGIIGGMIGEATLAMLYVPLFFYIFGSWSERRKRGKVPSGEKTGSAGQAPPSGEPGEEGKPGAGKEVI
ncbi:multidrug transporter [Geoanaerobacter pelophilus]|uniref:Multidrug transporter n=1 Tax=Geoanaerobacter pelophilus TaxID=60036 RepID=A0ABQ0MNX2_9BACT|nr:multidrug efflux RND transporter permease subunit [Geoanaerobacter pelophilus]GAW68762.1 multidrug transporter [Geoanaerobacter pelophilus]